MSKLEFPKGFLWGAATSAYQIEGNNHNDWSEWELKNAERLSKESGNKYPPKNYISGQACDHYNRFREDFDIAKSLNHNAHRFSIEWSRIEPEEGKWDEKEIEHYREVIRALRERGMEPFVTLWHWTLPIWVAKQGGWENKKTINDFVRYSEKITASLQGVKFYITLNETNVYAGHGYWNGSWPPGIRSFRKYLLANHHLSQAHILAYGAIKLVNPNAEVGVAHNFVYFSKFPAKIKDYFYNQLFLQSIKKHQDFIGVNDYFSDRPSKEKTNTSWSVDPEGLYQILKLLKKYNKPVYITENGVADAKDALREKFIKEHLRWVHRAISEGVDARGYFYWSLLDNFEWSSGFWPRFGLVEADYQTMERKPRQSAYKYAIIAKENSVEI